MTLFNKTVFTFPKNAMVVFDTSSIISNVNVIKNMFKDSPQYKPVITSGVYNELRGMRDDDKTVRGELAREIFPFIDEEHKKHFWYMKSPLSQPTIPGLSAVDENLINVCKKLHGAILFSNDQRLCEAANYRGIPTVSISTNAS